MLLSYGTLRLHRIYFEGTCAVSFSVVVCQTSFKNMSQQSNHNFKVSTTLFPYFHHFSFLSNFLLRKEWATTIEQIASNWVFPPLSGQFKVVLAQSNGFSKKGNSHSGNANCSPMVIFYMKHNVNCKNSNIQN